MVQMPHPDSCLNIGFRLNGPPRTMDCIVFVHTEHRRKCRLISTDGLGIFSTLFSEYLCLISSYMIGVVAADPKRDVPAEGIPWRTSRTSRALPAYPDHLESENKTAHGTVLRTTYSCLWGSCPTFQNIDREFNSILGEGLLLLPQISIGHSVLNSTIKNGRHATKQP